MEGLLKGTGESTNYWDIMVFSGVTTALGVSTVGGITALAADIECDVARFDTVAVCCAREAPPPLIPIFALVCAAIMFGMVWIRRLDVSTFQAFRSEVHVTAANYAKNHKEDELKALKSGIYKMLPHIAGKVNWTMSRLRWWAWRQLVIAALLLLATFIVLGIYLGTAVIVGGASGTYENVHGNSYYDFHCPSSCSIFTASPTALPTTSPTASPTLPTIAPTATPTILGAPTTAQPAQQPTIALTTTLPPTEIENIRCRIKPESPGLFWSLVGALLLCLVGTWKFNVFIFRLGRPTSTLTEVKVTAPGIDGNGTASASVPSQITQPNNTRHGEIRQTRRTSLVDNVSGNCSQSSTVGKEDQTHLTVTCPCCGKCGRRCCPIIWNNSHGVEAKVSNVPCSAGWETRVLLDYATGDERNLSLRVFRLDMMRFVVETFQVEFERASQKLKDTRSEIDKKTVVLKQLRKVWDWVRHSEVEPPAPVDFTDERLNILYTKAMSPLTSARETILAAYEDLSKFLEPDKPATCEQRVHDGERFDILQRVQGHLQRLETLVQDEDNVWKDGPARWTRDWIDWDKLPEAKCAELNELGFDSAFTNVAGFM